ncbi:MAG: regulator, partial [Corynebacterium flavescens]|nr:regulator [Corynebacterium flavescens]
MKSTAASTSLPIVEAEAKPETAATTPPRGMGPKTFIMKVLNGISVAVVVALVPQALLGEIAKALLPYWSGAA